MARTRLVNVRVTLGERQVFHAVARQQKKTVSELVRTFLEAEARRCGLWPVEGEGTKT